MNFEATKLSCFTSLRGKITSVHFLPVVAILELGIEF